MVRGPSSVSENEVMVMAQLCKIEAHVIQSEPSYWRRRILEAMWVKTTGTTSNLDCGLSLDPLWNPALDII